MLTWPAVITTRGFEVQNRSFLQTLPHGLRFHHSENLREGGYHGAAASLHHLPSNITPSQPVEVMFATEEAMAVRAASLKTSRSALHSRRGIRSSKHLTRLTGTQGTLADRVLHRRARCEFAHEGNGTVVVYSKRHPSEAVRRTSFKHVASGSKASSSKSKSQIQNSFPIFSF